MNKPDSDPARQLCAKAEVPGVRPQRAVQDSPRFRAWGNGCWRSVLRAAELRMVRRDFARDDIHPHSHPSARAAPGNLGLRFRTRANINSRGVDG